MAPLLLVYSHLGKIVRQHRLDGGNGGRDLSMNQSSSSRVAQLVQNR